MFRKFRRPMAMPVLCAAVAAIGLLAAPAATASVRPAQAGPAARFASEATAHQNNVIEGALARLPGGIRISASQARWPAHKIGLAVPASRVDDSLTMCEDSVPEPDFCGFTQANYGGSYVYGWNTTSDLWVAWGKLEPSQGMHSWYNALDTRVWREQFQNSGNELCIGPWSTGNYVDPSYSGTDASDYWILLTTNPSAC